MTLARDAIKSVMLAHAVPTIGILFSVLVLTYGAAKITLRVARHNGYVAGYGQARDSMKVATAKQFHVDELLHTRRSDSLHSAAPLDTAPLPHGPRIMRIDPDSQLVPTVPLSALVKVYVESDSMRPHYADRYLADLLVYDDSLIYKNLQPRLTKALRTNAMIYSAWNEERAAHNDADSSAHYWQSLYEEHAVPPKASHGKRDAVFATIGAVVALVAKHQLRHR